MNWNAWRQAYNSMSYADHQKFYEQVWKEYADQRHFPANALYDFFKANPDSKKVIEIGGWRGEAAKFILEQFDNIDLWTNVEICRPAAERAVTTDERYEALSPPDWIWNYKPLTYDTAVLSHVIEHMPSPQLHALISWLWASQVCNVFVASPLEWHPTDWTNYVGSHILDAGWEDVIDMFGDFKFVPYHSGEDYYYFRSTYNVGSNMEGSEAVE